MSAMLALAAASSEATTVEYIHTDTLGSIVAITDSNRVIIERREYEPFGGQLTPVVQNGPGYTGHVQDAATGLTYMQQRYYDPLLGRFLSVDPLDVGGTNGNGFNRYGYASANPYRFTDPDGRCEKMPGSSLCNRDNIVMTVSTSMLPAEGKIDMAPVQRAWPVPGHRSLNAADKPREGRGEFGSPRSTSSGTSTHSGIDIEAPSGSRVVAMQDGDVIAVSPNPSSTYGTQVVLDHGGGVYSQYAHLDSAVVAPGSKVNGGQTIGTVGRTGNTPVQGDSHLHLEVRLGSSAPRVAGGTVDDPLNYVERR